MKNILKGFIIGIGKIIPGVSGAMLAISLGVYDTALYHLNNFFKKPKESIRYLFPFAIGILLAILIFSKIINYTLEKHYEITMLFFIGLLLGGLPNTIKKVKKKDYYIVIISFIVFFFISIIGINNNYIPKNNYFDSIMYFISGVVEAISTVVPGISGTAMLMILGTYNIIIESLSNINFKILIYFAIGIMLGLLLTIKIFSYLFTKYSEKVYALIIGIFTSSIILLIIKVFINYVTISKLIIGILFMIFGIFISYFIEK